MLSLPSQLLQRLRLSCSVFPQKGRTQHWIRLWFIIAQPPDHSSGRCGWEGRRQCTLVVGHLVEVEVADVAEPKEADRSGRPDHQVGHPERADRVSRCINMPP